MSLLLFTALPARSSAPAPILIGACFAKTGTGAMENSPNFRITQLAAKAINAAGGVLGRPLKIIEFDTMSTPLGARQAALGAIDAEVVAVVGPSWSSQGIPMAKELQKAGIPMIGTTTTAAEVTQVGDFIFRTCYTDKQQAKALATFARQDLNATRAAVMTIAGDVYSEGFSAAFISKFTELGGTLTVQSRYLQDAMDFTPQVNAILANKPDIVFAAGFTRDSGLLLKQSRKSGIAVPFLGGDGWSPLERYPYLNPADGDNYYSSHWHRDMDTPSNRHFIALLKQELGEEAPATIDAGIPNTFDAVGLIAEAIRRAKSTEPAKIRDALETIENYEGVTGTISFRTSRDPLKSVIILQITNRGAEFVKAVTSP
ncbi:ABC transporter substrate-binding protein [Desulfovibrio mangrovi]|uniref:ABC transporter substrate-binding protein n=1 Tax=Desulfovibrio mangrovi TaxID=2976983 RepID=UPI002247EC02|nr:ABC transporter substrate-binding protein [Desulfovibrio mangrovi]UZP66052.1 ABC transporter substrate-binding protein [Desulfovibrio mangrovi]